MFALKKKKINQNHHLSLILTNTLVLTKLNRMWDLKPTSNHESYEISTVKKNNTTLRSIE